VSGQLYALAGLPPVKESRYTLSMRRGGPHSWSGRYRLEKNLLPPAGNGTQAVQAMELENYLSFAHDCLFSVLTAILHSWSCLHP
jgi:hypothetical protein